MTPHRLPAGLHVRRALVATVATVTAFLGAGVTAYAAEVVDEVPLVVEENDTEAPAEVDDNTIDNGTTETVQDEATPPTIEGDTRDAVETAPEPDDTEPDDTEAMAADESADAAEEPPDEAVIDDTNAETTAETSTSDAEPAEETVEEETVEEETAEEETAEEATVQEEVAEAPTDGTDDRTHDDSTHDDSTHDDSTHDDSTHDDSTHDDGHEPGGEDDHGGGHNVSFEATVNGQGFHADASPHLEGCALSIAISGMGEGEHTVTVMIVPTEGEGAAYLTDTVVMSGDAFAATYDMTEALSGVDPHANGFHIRVSVDVDGETATSRPLWLACGATGGGDPTLLTFDVQWDALDGTHHAKPPVKTVILQVDATTEKGTATCGYPDPSAGLVCTYSNHGGHGSEASGLVLPGGEKHTYQVSATGVPDGWEVDDATVGTFLGRDSCPRNHHDDSAESNACVHVVRIVEVAKQVVTTTTTTTTVAPTTSTDPLGPTTSTTAPATTTTTTASTTTTEQVLGPTVAGTGTLPVTGGDFEKPTFIGLTLLIGGAGLLALSDAFKRRAMKA